MSNLTNWRRHVHRTGRDLGIPAPVRVPIAATLVAVGAALVYAKATQLKAGDRVVLQTATGQRFNCSVLQNDSLFGGTAFAHLKLGEDILQISPNVLVGPADAAAQAFFVLTFQGAQQGFVSRGQLTKGSV